MLVGWMLRVAGTGVAVGAMVAVGVAAEGRAVAVGALPWVVVAGSVAWAPEEDCDDALELEDELLLEKGARVMLKLRWRKTNRSAATSTAARTAPKPSPSARRNPPEAVRDVGGGWSVGQTASRSCGWLGRGAPADDAPVWRVSLVTLSGSGVGASQT
jgi:hypothetical protein